MADGLWSADPFKDQIKVDIILSELTGSIGSPNKKKKLIINNQSFCIINDPLALFSVISWTAGDDSTTDATTSASWTALGWPWTLLRGLGHCGPAHRVPTERGLPEGHQSPGLSVRKIRGLHGHSLCPASHWRSEIQCMLIGHLCSEIPFMYQLLLRQNPKVMPKLLGMYDASAPKMDCIQKNYLLPTPVVYGDEDCLYLNVYRPEVR